MSVTTPTQQVNEKWAEEGRIPKAPKPPCEILQCSCSLDFEAVKEDLCTVNDSTSYDKLKFANSC